MLVWYIICENGFTGTRTYENENMAKDAAEFHANRTGMKWYIKCYKTYIRCM